VIVAGRPRIRARSDRHAPPIDPPGVGTSPGAMTSKTRTATSPLHPRGEAALRWLAAAATLAVAAPARATPPAPTAGPPGHVPEDISHRAGDSGHVVSDSPSEGPAPAPAASPTPAPADVPAARCQDRRDVAWIRRCLPGRNTWEIGGYLGVMFPAANSHELFDPYRQLEARQNGLDFWRPYRAAAPELGLRVAYFPLRFLGGEVEGAVMPTRVVEDGAPGGRANLFSIRAHFIAQVPLWRVAPFVVVGGGGLGTTGRLGNDIDESTHFGAGVKVFLSHRAVLRLDVRDVVAARKEVDAGATNYPEVLLGVSALLGRKAPKPAPEKDSDGDGFLDRGDACPYEPGIAPDGCPERDRDGDGFMDSQDACPDVPGVAPDGCPERDRDGDGFLDSVDRCPDVPGAPPDGCPIPDTDGDGILDDVDRCVDRPETYNGIDDRDGCPDEIPPKVGPIIGTIRGIYFDLDRDTIKPRSRPVLDRAVEVLKEFSEIRIEISGHTDSTGGHAYNRDLSRRRAESVKRYLVEHGIDTNRIQTRGAGPDEPLDTNRTPAGRAKNRRIEFELLVR
jgi:OOP family OmpA-OmpF porin